jgi:NADH-quinone oxidoreductase subunit C
MTSVEQLQQAIQARLADYIHQATIAYGELTVQVMPEQLQKVCLILRDEAEFKFEQLIDVCGVDYLQYGLSEWTTDQATGTGFERAVRKTDMTRVIPGMSARFAVVYHLLSTSLNQRVRLKVLLNEEYPCVDTVVDIWPAANWFEREAFDLYGILFNGHPDLRRILTDYGFIGHPFRKDFPLIGNVEMRYDAAQGRVIYEPVSIVPRVLVPKVIRDDSRYAETNPEQRNNG